MNTLTVRHFILAVILSLLTPFALAGDDDETKHDKDMQTKPVYTMSKILIDLNHFPSDKEKQKLQAIADNTDNSDAVRTIAQAIHDMEHQVSALHRPQLQAIAADETLDQRERKLAEVLMGINHRPDEEAKAELKNLKDMDKKDKTGDRPPTR